MADFKTCFDFMIQNEDPTLACEIVPDIPPGAHAISGINSAAYPADYAAIAALPQDQRLPAVTAFYQNNFWNKWIQVLTSNEVAMRVLDAAVNMGPGTAVKLLQTAVNAIYCPPQCIQVDGGWGPVTITAANGCEETELVEAFKNAREQHYRDIVAAKPEDAPYLPKWLARAGK